MVEEIYSYKLFNASLQQQQCWIVVFKFSCKTIDNKKKPLNLTVEESTQERTRENLHPSEEKKIENA